MMENFEKKAINRTNGVNKNASFDEISNYQEPELNKEFIIKIIPIVEPR